MHRLTSSLSAYACHVTRTWSRDTHSTWRNRVFNRSFRRKDEYLLLYTHFLTGKKKSSNSSVGLKKLDVKWSLNSANFASASHVTSQISTQLPASKSPGVTGSADKK